MPLKSTHYTFNEDSLTGQETIMYISHFIDKL